MSVRMIAGISLIAMSLTRAAEFPDPAIDNKGQKGRQTAVLAGGCFWCVEAVFQHIEGVEKVVSGYSGGDAASAHYEIVSTGQTGHAESVQVTFDGQKISYGQILKVFFRRGPRSDATQPPGTRSRSAVSFSYLLSER